MAPPRPLTNISTARPSTSDYQSLTPRTPHSRAGRAQAAHTELDIAEEAEDGLEEDEQYAEHHQSEPLLRSSASHIFPPPPPTNREQSALSRVAKDFDDWTDRLDAQTLLSRLPIVGGSLLAGILFFLTLVAYRSPGTLEYYVGAAKIYTPAKTTNAELISYENYTKFPLLPTEYVSECYKLNPGIMKPMKYWGSPDTTVKDVAHQDAGDTCTSTITYMLDGRVGLVSDLALMLQAAAFARERNRTLFIDDTYWNRGKWTDYFKDVRESQPGPEPGCKAPPPEELVACPRLARHWVINSHTAKFHLSHGFSDNYEDPYAHNLHRLKPIFSQTSDSLHQTLQLNSQTADLIKSARSELIKTFSPDGTAKSLKYIGVHLRRGDQKPSFNRNHYVPIPDFVSAVSTAWSHLVDPDQASASAVYIASDAPDAVVEFEKEMDDDGVGRSFSLWRSKDEQLRAIASRVGYVQQDFDGNYELEERISLTRGAIVDLALVSGLWQGEGEEQLRPQAVVCTIKSAICKLSAVALGWEQAFGSINELGYPDRTTQKWIEIDEKGQIVPVWKPFNLF